MLPNALLTTPVPQLFCEEQLLQLVCCSQLNATSNPWSFGVTWVTVASAVIIAVLPYSD
ncbi:hypothetical protein [Vibrio vulnificus YJ016]|uniref:Uncharacterized protein n=1 Tax=Vibrio vulnificus (strain YJ016) TaxID=196600 RepID=Q7MHN4_VIBVY|nr:hypothetical protein [Vibrio vulnificus YJ016]